MVDKFTKPASGKTITEKINEVIDNLGGGSSTDVQVNGTSITSNGVANIVTNTAYNSSSNKIATMSDLPTVPANVSAFTNDAGYTTNVGTITGITMNGASKGTSGVVDLGTVLTSHQDISGKANTDLSNCTKPYVKTTGGNSSAGYRIYSDGWCVQWGYIAKSSSNRSNQEITFTKEFASADAYTFTGHAHYTGSTSSSTSNISVNAARTLAVTTSENNTRTGKKITVTYINDSYRIEWIAFGQLKSGEY